MPLDMPLEGFRKPYCLRRKTSQPSEIDRMLRSESVRQHLALSSSSLSVASCWYVTGHGPILENVFPLSSIVLLRHKRKRFVRLICRLQHGQRESFRTMATINLRRIVAIEFGI